MAEPSSPCLKEGCSKRNKMLCSESCKELAAYQRYLALTHDRYSPPSIDMAESYGGSREIVIDFTKY